MKIVKFVFIFLLALVIVGFLGFKFMEKNIIEEVGAIPIGEIDLNSLEDGNYEGEYEIEPVYVKVKTTVVNKKLEKVEILDHVNGLGYSAEEIVEDIVEDQSLEVDNISGATISSVAIKKAIEASLTK